MPYIHQMGDGMERTGEPMDLLRRTIGGYIRHPNAAAALVIAQGPEANSIDAFLAEQNLTVGPNLRTLVIQDAGGLREAVEEGKRLVAEMLPDADKVERQPVPAAHIIVGAVRRLRRLLPGLSANPALGAAMDILVRHGGTAICPRRPRSSAWNIP